MYNRGGFCVAAFYFLVVFLVFVFTAYNTKPDDVGYDWIPFILLSVPWYGTRPRLLLPGLIAHVGLAYLLGMVLDKFWCRIVRSELTRQWVIQAGTVPAKSAPFFECISSDAEAYLKSAKDLEAVKKMAMC